MLKLEKNEEEKGITLIALVITIIILLILAGVSIAMLTGENGILTQTQRAKVETENAEEDELRKLTALEAATNLENTIYTDENNQTATIPAGFAVSKVEGENIIKDGLVIIDKNGNEFVWIPVDGINLKYEKHTYQNPEIDDTDTVTDTENGNWITQRYRKYTNWKDDGGNSESVIEYGGFYVARYEAGVPEDADFYASNEGDAYYTRDTTPSKNVTTYIPVSKRGEPVWNYISYENATKVSNKMYEDSTSVTSSLIDGRAWDTITQWLDNSGYNVTDSREWGNYYSVSFNFYGLYAIHGQETELGRPIIAQNYNKGNGIKAEEVYLETATGVTERNKANNIYDFAGNFFEMSTETAEVENGVYVAQRGGGFNSSDLHAGACLRLGNITPIGDFALSYRIVLYINT